MSRSVLACLLAFTCAQLAYGAHQFDHQATDVGESCEICLQTDRTDDVLHSVQSDEISFNKPATGVDQIATSPAVRYHRHYHSRAPPALS